MKFILKYVYYDKKEEIFTEDFFVSEDFDKVLNFLCKADFIEGYELFYIPDYVRLC